MLASVTSSVTSFVGNHGVYAVFFLMAIDAVFPAASELVMVYAGALAAAAFADQHVVLFGSRVSSGFWAFLVMSLSGTLGYTTGGIVGWVIGDYGGRPLLERHGRWLHLSPERLDRAEHWFERWDRWAVFLGRLTPIVRSFISVPAGVFKSPFLAYTALTMAGTAIWCFALAGIGWGVGTGYRRFDSGFRYAEYVVLAGIVLGGAILVLRRRFSRLAGRADSAR
ncbi:MAG TPA: DedA family protein [Gaiellaceae bacterium]|nr:DedA family protein [Gaiellaceae bacterium]